jgi:hypothetical protein
MASNGRSGMLLLEGKCSSLSRDTAPDCNLINGDQSIAEGVARELETISRTFLSYGDMIRLRVEKISPFMHHILYRSSIIFTDIHQMTTSYSAAEASSTINQMLCILGERWKAAGKIYS